MVNLKKCNYKLRMYDSQGNFTHEELFKTKESLIKRYSELYSPELYKKLLTPTGWEFSFNSEWNFWGWNRIGDVKLYNMMKSL